MFKSLGRYAARHPWPICAAWLLVGIAVSLVAPKWDSRSQDDDIRFLPARCDSVRGFHLLEKTFPQDVFASRLLFAIERPEAPLTERDLALVDEVVAGLIRLRQDEPGLQIKSVVCQRDPFVGPRLLSEDRRCTLIQISLGTPYLAIQTQTTVDRAERAVRAVMDRAGDHGLGVQATGPAGIGRDLITASGQSLEKTTLATILLVVVILLAVYRAPLLALVPLATIAISVWIALKILAMCTLIPGFYLVNISQVFAIVMLYGAGTDYCLFLISRYREELGRGHEPGEALRRSVGAVGGALTASAATVICGLGMMGFAEFAKIRSGGPAIAISLAVALAASLTLAPALLRLLGRAVFWPVGAPLQQRRRNEGVWGRLSKQVVARPMVIWTASVLLLLPLAYLGMKVRPNYRATGELSATSSSVQGLAVIQKHFVPGEVGPVTVLLESSTDWDSPKGRKALDHLSRAFGYLDNVAEVRSLTQPLGLGSRVQKQDRDEIPSEPVKKGFSIAALMPAKGAGLLQNLTQTIEAKANESAKDFYEARITSPDGDRFVTRLDVVLKTDPFDPRSVPTLEVLQTWVGGHLSRTTGLDDVRGETYGVTANARDMAQVTESDRLRVNALVIVGIFLILLALVRNPWLAGYLLVTVLFSYLVTLGATTLVAHWWYQRPLGEVDWRVPFFLFTILVAVGEDYNILLITRMMQERKRHGAVEGTRRALARTGGTITSCGLIMAGTFATLMLAGLNTLIQIGFALAFGVLLDTFVVRPFLVPALTSWVWKQHEGETAAAMPSVPRTSRLRRAG